MTEERDIWNRRILSAGDLERLGREKPNVWFDSYAFLAISYKNHLSKESAAHRGFEALEEDMQRWLELYNSFCNAKDLGNLDLACILAFSLGEQYEAIQRRHKEFSGKKISLEKLALHGSSFRKKIGPTPSKQQRLDFVAQVKRAFDDIPNDALAAEILENHPKNAKKLWNVKGRGWEENLRLKILNFLKNNRV